MKIKLLFFVLGTGFILASCSDKEKMAQMVADMQTADSTCQAGMMMMQTQMDSLHGIIDSMTMARNTVSTSTTTKTTTTTSDPVKKVDPPVKKKEGTNTGVDIKKKTGTNQGGGK